MKHQISLTILLFCLAQRAFCWGFFGHGKINEIAVYLLPPEMMVLYKPNSSFLEAHATDPDKRRYAVKEEGCRHYIDLDYYGEYPFDSLPRKWKKAVEKFSEDTLTAHGIVPWHIQTMLFRLTKAFEQKDFSSIMKNSAEIGHYMADAHVPLHTSSNHNGQKTNQKGIHGFWESRVPELLAEKEYDFFIGKAMYITDPAAFVWERVLESAHAVDSVLTMEKELTQATAENRKFAFEERNGLMVRQYATEFTIAYNNRLNNMVERRMRQSIFAVASLWYTAWVNAGQPNLKSLTAQYFNSESNAAFEQLNQSWLQGKPMLGREE
jgi:hypothetical protein